MAVGHVMRRAATVAAVAAGALIGSAEGWSAAVSVPVALVAVLVGLGWWPRGQRGIVRAAGGVALASGGCTLASYGGWTVQEGSAAGALMMVEYVAVAGLTFVVARLLPARRAAPLGALLSVTGATVVLRGHAYHGFLEAVGQCAFLAPLPLAAGAAGRYLYALHERRIRSVQEARRAQRLELARDLHDFVAHDVSGIVALAQAAQVVVERQPDLILPLLRQIEEAGQQALGAMDRTVHMLGDADDRPGPHGLDDIRGTVDRFRASGTTKAELEVRLSQSESVRVPRETAGTAHRVVVESLTNVRRHAPATASVRVTVHGAGPELVVTVTDAGREGPDSGQGRSWSGGDRRGGLGLVGLAERVEALGGSFTAGPHGCGWRVRAAFPLGPAGD
ncbi:histidine kinase [Streptomyces sp. SCA3-4]|uniref:sensor histidine kinase n=1 Tax=Streptomyces sichuanensis TaxID=2871810 RepID=UPI001CE3B48E|nr:histidine kinase [Streptomyces sichuanensis]MCA6092641.1 histidine kinase [Streptomyces sichuanensis]